MSESPLINEGSLKQKIDLDKRKNAIVQYSHKTSVPFQNKMYCRESWRIIWGIREKYKRKLLSNILGRKKNGSEWKKNWKLSDSVQQRSNLWIIISNRSR